MSDKERRYEFLTEALKIENDGELVATIIEHIGNVTVREISNRDGEFEVFMNPSGFTGRELSHILDLFVVREIGVYGDPDLSGTDAGSDLDGSLHMVVRIR